MREGGCRCGAVRYAIEGKPKFSVQCQCTDCQKITGSGHASIMIFDLSAVSIDGEPKSFSHEADNGHMVTHHFCGQCGAPLFNLNSHYDSAIYVQVGSLDDPSGFEPQRIVFADNGHDWDQMSPELLGYKGMPGK